MKIEQISANSYRVRKQYKNKSYTLYFDHKPTQKEITLALADKYNSVTQQKADNGTFEDYANKYIDYLEKSNKSPSTIRGYDSIIKNISEDFKGMNFFDIDNKNIQREVDRYAETRSPKTVKNMSGFITTVIGKYRPELTLSIKLPKADKKAEYQPTTKDIERIVEYSKDSVYSVGIRLCILGLRLGEVCVLTLDDLDEDNVLTINKDIVADKNGNLVIKDRPKTYASNRRLPLPKELADDIRKQGFITNYYPGSLGRYLSRIQKQLGIPHFRLHMLRHFCAAYLHKQGYTDQEIINWGGWETDYVMKNVYNYDLDPQEAKKDISDKLGSII